jgi:hypothetical protein
LVSASIRIEKVVVVTLEVSMQHDVIHCIAL